MAGGMLEAGSACLAALASPAGAMAAVAWLSPGPTIAGCVRHATRARAGNGRIAHHAALNR